MLAGHDIQHPEFRFLVPSAGQLVGEQPALLVRLPGIERGQPGRVQRRRVDQHPLRFPAGGRQQHPVLLPGQAAHEELPRAAPGRGADVPGGHQLLDPGLHPGPPGQPGLRVGPQRVLRPQPLLRGGAARVLQPAVRVGDAVPLQILDEVVAARHGIPGRVRARARRGGAGGSHGRTLREQRTCGGPCPGSGPGGGTGHLASRHAGVMSGRATPATLWLARTVLPWKPALSGNPGAYLDSQGLARHTSACLPHQAGGGLATGTAAERDV